MDAMHLEAERQESLHPCINIEVDLDLSKCLATKMFNPQFQLKFIKLTTSLLKQNGDCQTQEDMQEFALNNV
jgi:hypothetical protein